MALSAGAHHAAIMTGNIERFIEFYRQIFGADVLFDMTEEAPIPGRFRHAMLDLGGGFALHPIEAPSLSDHDDALPSLGKRGHVDHLAIQMADDTAFQEVRRRLVAAGASDGTESDFGSMKLVVFNDPDGMECEIALWIPGGQTRTVLDRVRRPYEG